MCWGLNTLETVTDAHMKIAHNPLDLVLEARVSELQAVDCALQTFKTEEKKLELGGMANVLGIEHTRNSY